MTSTFFRKIPRLISVICCLDRPHALIPLYWIPSCEVYALITEAQLSSQLFLMVWCSHQLNTHAWNGSCCDCCSYEHPRMGWVLSCDCCSVEHPRMGRVLRWLLFSWTPTHGTGPPVNVVQLNTHTWVGSSCDCCSYEHPRMGWVLLWLLFSSTLTHETGPLVTVVQLNSHAWDWSSCDCCSVEQPHVGQVLLWLLFSWTATRGTGPPVTVVQLNSHAWDWSSCDCCSVEQPRVGLVLLWLLFSWTPTHDVEFLMALWAISSCFKFTQTGD